MKKACCILLPKVSWRFLCNSTELDFWAAPGDPSGQLRVAQAQRHKNTTVMSRLVLGKVSEHKKFCSMSATAVSLLQHITPYSTIFHLCLSDALRLLLEFCWGFGKHSSLHVRPFAPLSQQIWTGIPWNTTVVWSRQNESGSSRFLHTYIRTLLNPSESKPKQTVFLDVQHMSTHIITVINTCRCWVTSTLDSMSRNCWLCLWKSWISDWNSPTRLASLRRDISKATKSTGAMATAALTVASSYSKLVKALAGL